MKIIKTYQNGYADVLAESPRECLHEKGDYIEVDYQDYYVLDYIVKDGQYIYQTKLV